MNKKINYWMIGFIAMCVIAVVFFIGFRVKANEVNDMKAASIQFSMDSYMEQQYVSGHITYDELSRYKSDQSDYMFKLGLALAAIFAGIALMFHGYTIVDARHHLKSGWDE
jgi:hypothetical protein